MPTLWRILCSVLRVNMSKIMNVLLVNFILERVLWHSRKAMKHHLLDETQPLKLQTPSDCVCPH